MEPDNTVVSTHLGQKSEYKDQYDPSLLVREPRNSNRVHLGIDDDSPPFVGVDVWNAYECSALTNGSMPVNSVAKIIYPATNKWIVESKSLKLYLNSFNMTKLGDTQREVIVEMKERIESDLSDLLETNVEVLLTKAGDYQTIDAVIHSGYETIEDTMDVTCTVFNRDPSLLKHDVRSNGQLITFKAHSTLLKSNCRVTHQPDWGDVFIYMQGTHMPTKKQLLKYIVSYRCENHFHEEICESIYTDLNTIFQPTELSVTCLYVRRGGIDINPQRASHEYLIDVDLADINCEISKTHRQ